MREPFQIIGFLLSAVALGVVVAILTLVMTLPRKNTCPPPQPPQMAVAACELPALPGSPAGSLPSGDAARLYIPQIHSTQEFVCTDGVLVHVTGYGNGAQK